MRQETPHRAWNDFRAFMQLFMEFLRNSSQSFYGTSYNFYRTLYRASMELYRAFMEFFTEFFLMEFRIPLVRIFILKRQRQIMTERVGM